MNAQPQADARGKVYRRVTDGIEDFITVKEALAIVNDAMMGGKAKVHTMMSEHGKHAIRYRSGTVLLLIEIDAPQASTDESSETPARWSTTHSGWMAHRFNQADRALCNKSIRPRSDTLIRDDYRSRAYYAASPNTWRICPRCDSK